MFDRLKRRRAPRHSIVSTEYGNVLLDESQGRYWHLNDSALVVARTFIDGGRHEDAVGALVAEFGIDREVAERDVDATHGQLREVGVL